MGLLNDAKQSRRGPGRSGAVWLVPWLSVFGPLSELAHFAVRSAEVGDPYVGTELQWFAQELHAVLFQLGDMMVEIVNLEADVSETVVVLLQLASAVHTGGAEILE